MLEGSKLSRLPYFSVKPPSQSNRKASGDVQIGSELKFILDIFAGLVGAPVAVGVPDSQRSDIVVVIRRSSCERPTRKLKKSGEAMVPSWFLLSSVLSCV